MLTRRELLKAGTAVGLPCSTLTSAVAQALPEIESSSWCACVINCGQRCPVRCFTKKGQVIRIETDNSLPDASPSPAFMSLLLKKPLFIGAHRHF